MLKNDHNIIAKMTYFFVRVNVKWLLSKVSVSTSDSEELEEIMIAEDGSAIAKPLVMAARVRINACAIIHAGHVFKLQMVATQRRVRVQISVHSPVHESSPRVRPVQSPGFTLTQIYKRDNVSTYNGRGRP